MAWELPPLFQQAQQAPLSGPTGSSVAAQQMELWHVTRDTLAAVAEDVRQGLLETVGIHSRQADGSKAAVVLELPAGADARQLAQAIDMENLEAWCTGDEVYVAIGPWYTTKDVDQVVLCVTKVVHVLLGLHAAPVCELPAARSFSARVLAAAAQVLTLQRHYSDKS